MVILETISSGMRKNVRIVFSLLAVLLLAVSCCTHRTARTALASSSAAATVQIVRDSLFVVDSVMVRERADTVFLTRTRTLYRDRVRIDTLWQCDTVVCIKEVVKPAEKQGNWLFYLVIALLSAFLLYRLFRRNS